MGQARWAEFTVLGRIFDSMEYAEAGRSIPMVRVVVGNQRMGLL
jgi:hypothetical protein